MLSPIVIFVYNRVERVQSLIESLSKNPEAKESVLYVYSDGPKNEADNVKIKKVRQYIEQIPQMGIFKDVILHESEVNKGLAPSIIQGVTEVMNHHGRAIIIEDDNIVSPNFLRFMNGALEFYKDNDNIWAINGFSRKMAFPDDYQHSVYAIQRISSYSWASWEDRWSKMLNQKLPYPAFLWSRKMRKEFARYGEDRPEMFDAQVCKKISSWAIVFDYAMMSNGMYCIAPCISRVICTGNDGSGTHSKEETHLFDAQLSEGQDVITLENVEIDERIRKEFAKPYKHKWTRVLFGNIDFILRYYLHIKR